MYTRNNVISNKEERLPLAKRSFLLPIQYTSLPPQESFFWHLWYPYMIFFQYCIGSYIGPTMYIQLRVNSTNYNINIQYAYITGVSCALKRVGHACICPTMVTGHPVLKAYSPPPSRPPQKRKFGSSAAKN